MPANTLRVRGSSFKLPNSSITFFISFSSPYDAKNTYTKVCKRPLQRRE